MVEVNEAREEEDGWTEDGGGTGRSGGGSRLLWLFPRSSSVTASSSRRMFLSSSAAVLTAATLHGQGSAVKTPSVVLPRPVALGFDNFSVRASNWKALRLLEYATTVGVGLGVHQRPRRVRVARGTGVAQASRGSHGAQPHHPRRHLERVPDQQGIPASQRDGRRTAVESHPHGPLRRLAGRPRRAWHLGGPAARPAASAATSTASSPCSRADVPRRSTPA